MCEVRKEIKKTRGQAGWGTLYLLQRLSAEGVPEPHYKASAGEGAEMLNISEINGMTEFGTRTILTGAAGHAEVAL